MPDYSIYFLFVVILIVIVLAAFLFLLFRNLFIPDQKIKKKNMKNFDCGFHDLHLPLGSKSGNHYFSHNRPNCPCINV